jgi:acetate kinase
MEPVIAVFNAGSSSLKFAFYEGDHGILSGQIDGIGIRPAAKAFAADGTALERPNLAAATPTTPSDVLPGQKRSSAAAGLLRSVIA